jgi:hypothetical protein
MHQNLHYLQKDQKEILHDPRHLGVPSGASKMIYEAVVRLVQTVDLSCTETNTISKLTETRFYMIHVTCSSISASKMISELTVRSAQTVHLSWINISTITKQTETTFPFEPRHLGEPSGAAKTIYEAMVQLAQTVHLSCTETNTVFKPTETSFHLSLVTQEYHPVHAKQFLSLWYISKPRAPKPTPSPKGSKWDSTWPTSPRISIGCIQIGFWGYGTFGANCGSILHRY